MEGTRSMSNIPPKDQQHKQFLNLLGIDFQHSKLDIDIVLEGKEVSSNLQG